MYLFISKNWFSLTLLNVNPLLELDDSVDAEEIQSGVCDNYLLCISESNEKLKDKSQDVDIGIVVSTAQEFM